jgi:Domain of unknown function (DUF5134)
VAGQTWLAYTFAGVMLVTAAYCLARLVISWRQHRRTDHQVDAIHVLMGVAMAGMLVPSLRVFWSGGWEVVFGAGTLWFGWLAMREYRNRAALGRFRPHHVQHALGCAAMVYMFAAVTTVAKAASAGSGMGDMGGPARFPTLALILAVTLFGYVIWTADRLSALSRVSVRIAAAGPVAAAVPALAVPAGGGAVPAAPDDAPAPARRPAGPALSPRLAACCEIAMGVTMGYALILML